MHLGRYQFRPNLYMTIIVVIFILPLFIVLGVWQLQRAEEKQLQLSLIELTGMMEPHDLSNNDISSDQALHRKITARGRYLYSKQILIENRKNKGKNGYHVITPLQIDSSDRYLLINRGWISTPSEAESVTLRQVQLAPISVAGTAVTPLPPALDLSFSPADEQPWPYLTLDHYAKWSGLELYPFMLLQDAVSPHGFSRDWPQKKPSDTMHIGYAIQWFAFAIITSVLWLRLSLIKETDGRSSQ